MRNRDAFRLERPGWPRGTGRMCRQRERSEAVRPRACDNLPAACPEDAAPTILAATDAPRGLRRRQRAGAAVWPRLAVRLRRASPVGSCRFVAHPRRPSRLGTSGDRLSREVTAPRRLRACKRPAHRAGVTSGCLAETAPLRDGHSFPKRPSPVSNSFRFMYLERCVCLH